MPEYAPGIEDKHRYGEPTRDLTPGQLVSYVLQHHRMARNPSRPHFDLRLGTPETNLFSWAIPKATRPVEGNKGKRLAVQTQLHDFGYGKFKGNLPSGYGMGQVGMEDSGKARITKTSPNAIHFSLEGRKVPEDYVLVNINTPKGRNWLWVKKKQVSAPGETPVANEKAPGDEMKIAVDAADLETLEKTAKDDWGWIGVDLDGTLAKYTSWKGKGVIGEPIPKMVKRVKRWLAADKKVKIMTARMHKDKGGVARRAIKKWCKEHLGQEIPITNVKDHEMSELWDDRAIQVRKNKGVKVGQALDKIAIKHPDVAPEGKCWAVRWAGGRAIQCFRHKEHAQAWHDSGLGHYWFEVVSGMPKLIEVKKGWRVQTKKQKPFKCTDKDCDHPSHKRTTKKAVKIEADVLGDGATSVLRILAHLQCTGQTGHSHEVVVDPDVQVNDGRTTVGWDGDGCDSVNSIRVEKNKLSRKNLKDLRNGKFKMTDAAGYRKLKAKADARKEAAIIPTAQQFISNLTRKLMRFKPRGLRSVEPVVKHGAHPVHRHLTHLLKAKEDIKHAEKEANSNGSYSYSSTQVQLPDSIAKKVMTFSAKIPDADLYLEGDDADAWNRYGREDDIHITVKYGLHTNDVRKVRKALAGVGPIMVTMGKTSLFVQDDYDVLKIGVSGKGLHDLNKKISAALVVTDTYPDYKPHMTVAYVKSGKGKKYAGKDDFVGKIVTFDAVVFSSKDKQRHTIPLTTEKKAADDTIALCITAPDGSEKAAVQVEIADTPNTRRIGLSKRAELPDGHGMFFDKAGAYWMKGVNFPLDIVFMDKAGTILEMQHMPVVEEFSPDMPVYTSQHKQAAHALELPAGWFKTQGIELGDQLQATGVQRTGQ